MKSFIFFSARILLITPWLLRFSAAQAQNMKVSHFSFSSTKAGIWLIFIIAFALLAAAFALKNKVAALRKNYRKMDDRQRENILKEHTLQLNSRQ
ncbi:MAG: hypothetical protein J0H29_10000, partial [Sphingobacteriales bacterium]|nr:hypothetical protein [Sphingobacteriales bacterium]